MTQQNDDDIDHFPDAFALGKWEATERLLDFLESGGELDKIPLSPTPKKRKRAAGAAGDR